MMLTRLVILSAIALTLSTGCGESDAQDLAEDPAAVSGTDQVPEFPNTQAPEAPFGGVRGFVLESFARRGSRISLCPSGEQPGGDCLEESLDGVATNRWVPYVFAEVPPGRYALYLVDAGSRDPFAMNTVDVEAGQWTDLVPVQLGD